MVILVPGRKNTTTLYVSAVCSLSEARGRVPTTARAHGHRVTFSSILGSGICGQRSSQHVEEHGLPVWTVSKGNEEHTRMEAPPSYQVRLLDKALEMFFSFLFLLPAFNRMYGASVLAQCCLTSLLRRAQSVSP